MYNISGRMVFKMKIRWLLVITGSIIPCTISNNFRRHFYHFSYHGTTRPARYMMNKIHLYHFYIIFIYRILLNLFSSWI